MANILLIEDNENMRENTSEILTLAGHHVETASNGKEGVIKAQINSPDLIVCDIMMPELDGYGVLHMLNRDPNTNHIPFIFLTAKADRADIRKGMDLGADDYVTKPFDDVELLSAVDVRLKKSNLLNAHNFVNMDNGFDKFINQVKSLEEFTKVEVNSKIKNYKKKEVVYSESNVPLYLYYIVSGKVKTVKNNKQDKELITGLYDEGDFFGYVPLMENDMFDDEAIAMEETQLKLIPKDFFFQLLHQNRDVSNTFMKLLSKQVKDMETRLLKLAYDSVRKKVSESLLMLKDTYGKESESKFSFPISREDLAHIAGTATETLIRTLTDFKDEGMIEIKGSTITILSEDKLRSMKN
jgi:CRP/FNR family transcriptional regulator, polysaccharide utilization system transcription regulator